MCYVFIAKIIVYLVLIIPALQRGIIFAVDFDIWSTFLVSAQFPQISQLFRCPTLCDKIDRSTKAAILLGFVLKSRFFYLLRWRQESVSASKVNWCLFVKEATRKMAESDRHLQVWAFIWLSVTWWNLLRCLVGLRGWSFEPIWGHFLRRSYPVQELEFF